jgi:hypothetical protein
LRKIDSGGAKPDQLILDMSDANKTKPSSHEVAFLPSSVRYVKNGRGGQWWPMAKANGQLHSGWSNIPDSVLRDGDMAAIQKIIRNEFAGKVGAIQDFNALRTLLDRPSEHIWVTFQDGCMWWCTVKDGIEINPDGETKDRGHFWVTCDQPWSDHSVHGRHLATANLPGIVTMVAGFQATICKPKGWKEILRIIRDDEDTDVAAAAQTREAYEIAVAKLIARLRPKDFELLIDLILSRTWWVRLATLGGTTEGIDVEAENVAADEIAFGQVKSAAGQGILDKYIAIFGEQRERYQRMIFAVHTPTGPLTPPPGQPVQVWTGGRIARLVVRHGLGEWVGSRV